MKCTKNGKNKVTRDNHPLNNTPSPGTTVTNLDTLKSLKSKILAIEGRGIERRYHGQAIDSAGTTSPFADLRFGALHEFQCASYGDRAAACGVVLGLCTQLMQRRAGPVILCQRGRRVNFYGPGLLGLGLDVGRLLDVRAPTQRDTLWALEEALACRSVSAVVGVLWGEGGLDFTTSRRLRLRAREAGTTAFLLRSCHNGIPACDTRWRIACLADGHGPSFSNRPEQLGALRWQTARWRVDLLRSRTAKPGTWHVAWNRETLRFDLAERVADHALVPAPDPILVRQAARNQ